MNLWYRPNEEGEYGVEFVLVWPDELNSQFFWFMNVENDSFGGHPTMTVGRQLTADSNLTNIGFRLIWKN